MLLREAAIDAVKQWKYAPELIDGKPVAAQVTIGVEFRLN
jgi:outer membrane biosynthesis protein TonB